MAERITRQFLVERERFASSSSTSSKAGKYSSSSAAPGSLKATKRTTGKNVNQPKKNKPGATKKKATAPVQFLQIARKEKQKQAKQTQQNLRKLIGPNAAKAKAKTQQYMQQILKQRNLLKV